MKTTNRFPLIALLVVCALLSASTQARAGGQTKSYEVVPAPGVEGGGWVKIQITGPISERGLPYKYWSRQIESNVAFPDYDVIYVFFDLVPGTLSENARADAS